MSEENSSEIKECPFCAQKLDIRTKLPGSDRSCFNGVGETAKYGRAGFNAELNSVSQAAHVTRNRASNVSSVVFLGEYWVYTISILVDIKSGAWRNDCPPFSQDEKL